jgi:hypothetical protein
MRVIAIDPGSEHVGWSLGAGELISSWGEDSPEEFLVRMDQPPVVGRVVVERFDLRQFTKESQLTVEFIGAIKNVCRQRKLDLAFVNASSKKKFINTLPSKITGHARDAEAIRLYDLHYGTW